MKYNKNDNMRQFSGFLFDQPIFLETTPSYTKSPKGLKRRTFGDCITRIFYRSDALTVDQPSVSKQ